MFPIRCASLLAISAALFPATLAAQEVVERVITSEEEADKVPPPPMMPPPPINIVPMAPLPPPVMPPPVISPPPVQSLARRPSPSNNVQNWIALDDEVADTFIDGFEGRTMVALTVNSAGRVSTCEVETSSGSAVLDETACWSIQRFARFNPALDELGNPTAGTWRQPVNWQIEPAPPVRELVRLPLAPGTPPGMLPGTSLDISVVEYPAIPLRDRTEGTTIVNLFIGADGKLRRCEVSESSGSPHLDQASCRLAVRIGTYQPARDEAGNPVEGSFEDYVDWYLPDE